MKWLRRLSAAVLFSLAAASSPLHEAAAKEKWPDRPVRIIVPFAAGGSTDVVARAFAAELSAEFGQQFFVENRAGAGAASSPSTLLGPRFRGDANFWVFLFSPGVCLW